MNEERFMSMALAEARAASEHGDVPVGAVAARGDEVVAGAHNERELRGDPTAHAEILALQRASKKLGRWRLDDLTLFVTVEPCPMCAGAIVASRIPRLVYGAADERAGAAFSLYNIVQDPRLNHQCEVTVGLMAEESAALMREFFRGRRRRIERL